MFARRPVAAALGNGGTIWSIQAAYGPAEAASQRLADQRKGTQIKKLSLLALVVALAGLGLWFAPGFMLRGQALPNCPGTAFSKQAMIFDAVAICATSNVPDEKLKYAANVTAEWLDNDGDGSADEPRLIEAFKTSKPFLIMTPNGAGAGVMAAVAPSMATRIGQDLSASETNPDGDRRDASQEEIHHLILNAGWAVAFPEVFGNQAGSAIHAQWTQAEQQGNYSYNDPTCDANCKVVEFFYLATAAYLGSAPDLASDEMRLKDRAALSATLPETVATMTSNAYHYPLNHWPTGSYEHGKNIVFFP